MAVKENIWGFDFQARFAKEIGGSVRTVGCENSLF
jgi:hypothetical protein